MNATTFTSQNLNDASVMMTATTVRVMKRCIRVNLVQGGWVDFSHSGAYVAGPYPTAKLLAQLNDTL